ncbi:interleukin-20 receptor subunit alpha [Acanthopagrus latus]|uniref:interleukin-20 receptor subunit alpha n=1 Tax=Acanthopagrus latus TaxID=8177 RepID=UPI00187CADAF|nr:interleukin-20 receptor subunit alpha [Acanthopagrus latus]
MWTLVILLSLGALHCSVSSAPPSPINVIFSSVNLRNTLQWVPGNGTLDDTHFTVQYAIYGDSVQDSKRRRAHWRTVHRCTETVRHWCDLSNETWDLDHGYFARVRAVSRRASSKWVMTRRFDPKLDTTFGPPLVSIEIENNSAVITLKGPMRYQPNNHTPVVSMATLYPHMRYILSIHNTHRGQMSHFPVVSSPYKYRLMDYNTEYCFSAKAKFLSMPVQCHSSAWHCITTPQDPVIDQLKRVVVGIVVPSACICIMVVVGYLLHHYLAGKGQESPLFLNQPSYNWSSLTWPPVTSSLDIHVIPVLCSISDPEWPKQQPPIADSPPGYAPQRSETPQEPEGPFDDVSIDYAFVGRAPINDRDWRPDDGEDGNSLNGEHQNGGSRANEGRVEGDDSTGVHTPQKKSFHSQRSTHIRSQTHAQTEMNALTQVQACSQVSLVPLTQIQAPSLSFQGEVDREKEDREFPGLFINRTPQNGLFHIPLNMQTKEGEMEDEINQNVSVRADGQSNGGVEEVSESEGVPLLSAYASQNNKVRSSSHVNQSNYLPDDYGVLRLATADEIGRDEEEEEDEEGTNFIDWDPNTRKLVLPDMAMEITKVAGLDGSMQGEKGDSGVVGEEMSAMKGELRLANVFVRQGSEEEAEAQRTRERGEADDIIAKWNLVISMDP